MKGRRLLIAFLFLAAPLFLAGCDFDGLLTEKLAQASGLDAWQIGVILAAGTLVSEDLSCVSAGVLVSHHVIPFWAAAFACFLGIWVGDMGLYWLGRLGGLRLIRRFPFNWWISERRLEAGEQLFARHGGKLIFTSRFLPGSRVPVYVAAGLLGFPFWRFALAMAVACALWTPLLVGFAMKLGDVLLKWLAVYEKAAGIGFVLVVAIVWLVIQILEYTVTHRGRRLLYSKWSRLREWEFWPLWAFYPPVFAYIVFLGLKHRCLTLFTLANPGIPLGGLALESKGEILAAVRAGEAGVAQDRVRVARFAVIAPGEIGKRTAAVDDFLRANGLDYPVVLKPDIGERGQGVAVAASARETLAYLESCAHAAIVQEYVEGLEFGVFYFRYPGAERGAILSITEKTLPAVTGDGERTLEQLILDDPRAVKMARFFLEKWSNHLGEVRPAGERVRLTNLGTHCRGAVFHDGRRHRTEALTEAIDSLSRGCEGFFFGRYDLRVPSREDFEAGRNLRVLELNGVSSESTHIYEPGNSLCGAYRDLFRQWRIAFEIGAIHRSAGLAPASLGEVWRVIRAHAAHDWFETEPEPEPPLGELVERNRKRNAGDDE